MPIRLSTSLLLSTALSCVFVCGAKGNFCTECSVTIMDASALIHQECDAEKLFAVNPDSGVVHLKASSFYQPNFVNHYHGTHSGPWHFQKALRKSNCYTDDLGGADFVFVDDYCLYSWWLAGQHSLGAEGVNNSNIPDKLLEAWKAVRNHDRWQQKNGSDFVFYQPHPGFASLKKGFFFKSQTCNDFRNSVHIVAESSQRDICKFPVEEHQVIIAPYVPNVVDTASALGSLLRSNVPLQDRKAFVYFHGTCHPAGQFPGKKMRELIVKVLSLDNHDVSLTCVASGEKSFAKILDDMEHSVFCLVLPGDGQSTRRLSEAFVSGCVPVFVGPPFHSMPLHQTVDYRASSIIINVTDYHQWLAKDMIWHKGEGYPGEGQDPTWWTLDSDVAAIHVQSLADIVPVLRQVTEEEVRQKLELMQSLRYKFTFQGGLKTDVNAVGSIVKQLCSTKKDSDTHVATTKHQARHSISGGRVLRKSIKSQLRPAGLLHSHINEEEGWQPFIANRKPVARSQHA